MTAYLGSALRRRSAMREFASGVGEAVAIVVVCVAFGLFVRMML